MIDDIYLPTRRCGSPSHRQSSNSDVILQFSPVRLPFEKLLKEILAC